MDDNHHHHNHDDDDHEHPDGAAAAEDNDDDHPLLPALLQQLRRMAAADGYQADDNGNGNGGAGGGVIDLEKSRNILGITGGDVAMAAQLYWDDFLANQARAANVQQQVNQARAAAAAAFHPAQQQQPPRPPPPPPPQQQQPQNQPQQPGRQQAQNRLHRAAAAAVQRVQEGEEHRRAAGAVEEDDDDEEDADSPIPRRLERDFNRLQRLQQQQAAANARRPRAEHEDDDEEDDDDDEMVRGGVARIIAQARETVRRLEGGRRRSGRSAAAAAEDAPRPNDNGQDDEEVQNNNDNDHPNANVAGLAVRAAEAFLAARGEQAPNAAAAAGGGSGGSVSVSDDESAGVWKFVGGIAARLDQEGHLAADGGGGTGAADSVSPKRKRRKMDNKKNKKNDDEDEGYLSDNDWMWESFGSRTSIPLCTPFDVLWNLPVSASTKDNASAPVAAGPAAEDDGTGGDGAAAVEGNVIADEDDGDEEEETTAKERSGIPRQWLNASFSLSDDGTGLVLQPPTEEDIGFFSWQQQAAGEAANNSARNINTPPPPFHCSSLSALLSIVTALLYTGACVQTRSITCKSARKPFAELTLEERKREFEPRLADALAVLLHIAATASRARKQAALQTLSQSKNAADVRKWQKLSGKLHLCPTCWWETDGSGETRFPVAAAREADRDLQVATSYTNLDDLRAYVLSNMRSFTTRGGCALFLETIMRIHGKGAVLRMVERSRQRCSSCAAGSKKITTNRSLIQCTCEERSKKIKVSPKQLRQRSKTKEFLERLPEGRDCMSLELISLLLTGKVHSTLKGWTTGPMGLGILSNQAGQVARALARPEKPVWLLFGPSIYSVLWMNAGNYEVPRNFARADQPDSMVELTHFSPWTNRRHKTTLRLSANRSQWTAPRLSKPHAVSSTTSSLSSKNNPSGITMVEILLRRRQEAARLVSSDELEAVDLLDPELVVTQEQLEAIQANPEDETFYPGQYRLWRFHIGKTSSSSSRTDNNHNAGGDDDQKPAAAPQPMHAPRGEWIPFHRLNERQKLLVETKLGPQINTILWTRWPRAQIEAFHPQQPDPLV